MSECMCAPAHMSAHIYVDIDVCMHVLLTLGAAAPPTPRGFVICWWLLALALGKVWSLSFSAKIIQSHRTGIIKKDNGSAVDAYHHVQYPIHCKGNLRLRGACRLRHLPLLLSAHTTPSHGFQGKQSRLLQIFPQPPSPHPKWWQCLRMSKEEVVLVLMITDHVSKTYKLTWSQSSSDRACFSCGKSHSAGGDAIFDSFKPELPPAFYPLVAHAKKKWIRFTWNGQAAL